MSNSPGAGTGLARCRPMLGTYVEIRVDDDLPAHSVDLAIDTAFDAIALCARLMSFHDPASELSRINRAGAGDVLSVHPWTAQALNFSRQMFDATDGVFDAGVGAQLVDWGLLPAHSGAPFSQRASLSDLECLSGQHIVVHRPTCIDLGGIAKGFAVDRAIEALSEQGIRQAVVNAGGDLRVLGDVTQDIHVRHPQSPMTLIHLGQLSDGALASSAPYFSRQARPSERAGAAESSEFSEPSEASEESGARDVCALVDARSRRPLLAARSYTVIAPQCWIADALTKVLASGMPPESDCFSRYGAQPLLI